MKVGKITQSIENIKKNTKGIMTKSLLAILLSLSTVMQLFNCPSPIPDPQTNKAPDTQITKEFKDNGEVEYTVSGTDSEGSIANINVNTNGNYQTVPNNSTINVPIVEGNNTIIATAYDNEGLKDSSPATDYFNSPTEGQARTSIDNILDSRSETHNGFEKDVFVDFGSFYVDYLIRKKDGNLAIVNYIEHQKNLEQELSNKGILDSWGIPNLYIPRFPESEINLNLNEFIDNGYN